MNVTRISCVFPTRPRLSPHGRMTLVSVGGGGGGGVGVGGGFLPSHPILYPHTSHEVHEDISLTRQRFVVE